jgi:hypothetical protein
MSPVPAALGRAAAPVARAADPAPWLWSEVEPSAHFASDYAEARAKFLAAASALALPVETHVHPSARGPAGETLAVDLALLGEAAAPSLLLVTSGTHGAEGFCGSGCQVALLSDASFVDAVKRSGVAVAFLHALNPFGFAHLARTTEDNVDLNRNFRDFADASPNAAYLEIHDHVVPDEWPPTPANEAWFAKYVEERGWAALQSAYSTGQADRPDGLFYAGAKPAWSNRLLRDVLRRHAAARRRFAWIDVHTGLGPLGHGEKIYAGPDDPETLARTRTTFGADVTSIYDGTSTSARVTGMLFQAIADCCPGPEYAGIALEFGTLALPRVMEALRARQWLANHADATAEVRSRILRQARDAFYVDTPAWKAMVFAQSRSSALAALAALREGGR